MASGIDVVWPIALLGGADCTARVKRRAVSIPYVFSLYSPNRYCTVWMSQTEIVAYYGAIRRIRRFRAEFAKLRHDLARPRSHLPEFPDSWQARKGILGRAPFRPRDCETRLAYRLAEEVALYQASLDGLLGGEFDRCLRDSVDTVRSQAHYLRIYCNLERVAEKKYYLLLHQLGLIGNLARPSRR